MGRDVLALRVRAALFFARLLHSDEFHNAVIHIRVQSDKVNAALVAVEDLLDADQFVELMGRLRTRAPSPVSFPVSLLPIFLLNPYRSSSHKTGVKGDPQALYNPV